jgi:hypothetical protein
LQKVSKSRAVRFARSLTTEVTKVPSGNTRAKTFVILGVLCGQSFCGCNLQPQTTFGGGGPGSDTINPENLVDRVGRLGDHNEEKIR